MTECTKLSDRAVAVASGQSSWTKEEEVHLVACDDCRREWTVVRTAARAGRHLELDAGQISRAVTERLRTAEVEAPRVIPFDGGRWLHRGAVIAVAAALLFWVGREAIDRSPDPAPAEPVPAVFTELDELSEDELALVLEEFPDAGALAMPEGAIGLSDLTTSELESLLSSWEKETES